MDMHQMIGYKINKYWSELCKRLHINLGHMHPINKTSYMHYKQQIHVSDE